jgi:hypothetical protein
VSVVVDFLPPIRRPFRADDPHEVGQALLPAATALLDRDQAEAASLSEGVLDRRPARAGPRRYRIGRTAQFNARTTPGTVAAFCAIADQQGWLIPWNARSRHFSAN